MFVLEKVNKAFRPTIITVANKNGSKSHAINPIIPTTIRSAIEKRPSAIMKDLNKKPIRRISSVVAKAENIASKSNPLPFEVSLNLWNGEKRVFSNTSMEKKCHKNHRNVWNKEIKPDIPLV